MLKALELAGQKFGMLTVLSKAPSHRTPSGITQTQWFVQCDCGSPVKPVRTSALKQKTTVSCGCNHGNPQAPGLALRNYILRNYQASATKRHLIWEISDEQFDALTKQNCHYCGIEPFTTIQKRGYLGSYTYNGIDRVNNKKGYIVGNLVPCCKPCNYAKGKMTTEEFTRWLNRVRQLARLSVGAQ